MRESEGDFLCDENYRKDSHNIIIKLLYDDIHRGINLEYF